MKKFYTIILTVILAITHLLTLTACASSTPQITSETGIVIKGYEFGEDAQIVFSYIEDQTVIDTVKTAISAQDYKRDSDVFVLNLSVISDNQKTQPDGKVEVSIPTTLIPNLAPSLKYVIFHLKDDMTIERLSVTVNETDLKFSTTSFSYFVLAERNLEPTGPQIDNSTDLNQTDKDNHYTSKSLCLVTEINGSFTTDRPFTLDTENSNKRTRLV